MKLITKALEARFSELGIQETNPDPIVVAKFFNPSGIGTWYATEYDKESKICFGYVQLLENEWGYFSIDELEAIKTPPFGLPIERDLYCGEKKISEHCPELIETIEKRKAQNRISELKKLGQEKEDNDKSLSR